MRDSYSSIYSLGAVPRVEQDPLHMDDKACFVTLLHTYIYHITAKKKKTSIVSRYGPLLFLFLFFFFFLLGGGLVGGCGGGTQGDLLFHPQSLSLEDPICWQR